MISLLLWLLRRLYTLRLRCRSLIMLRLIVAEPSLIVTLCLILMMVLAVRVVIPSFATLPLQRLCGHLV